MAMSAVGNGAKKLKLSDEEAEVEKPEDSFMLPHPVHMKIGEEGVASLAFHPQKDLLAIATTGGRVRLYDVHNREEPELLRVCGKRWHRTGRMVRFDPVDGRRVFSASAEGGLKVHDVETGARVFRRLRAHSDPISALLPIDADRVVSGSESGELKIFDCRMPTGCAYSVRLGDRSEEEERQETDEGLIDAGVNDLALGDDGKHLMVACDDGCLRVVSIRGKRRVLMCSENLGYPARTVSIVKGQTKVLVGTEEGVMNMFNWQEWGNLSDRISVLGKSTSDDKVIEAVTKVSEDVVCVASDDGKIRAVNIHPNRVLGLVGEHKDREDTLCDHLSLALAASGNFLASGCLGSSTVRFWPVQHLVAAGEEEAENLKLGRKRKRKDQLQVGRHLIVDKTRDFLRDLCGEADKADATEDSSDDDSDDDDDSEDSSE